MAVTNVSICSAAQAVASKHAEWSYGYQVHAGAVQPGTFYICFETQSWDWLASFAFKLRWRGIPNGMQGTGEAFYNDWSAYTAETTITVTSANFVQKFQGGGAYWKFALADIMTISDITSNSSFTFDNRKYDQVQIQVEVYANYGTDGQGNQLVDAQGRTHSETTSADLWIGYFPSYQLQTLERYGSDAYRITYTATGWNRTDDRYELLVAKKTSKAGPNILNKVWGSQDSAIQDRGVILFPSAAFTEQVDIGDKVYLTVRWNAAYRESGSAFGQDTAVLTVTGTDGGEPPIEVDETDDYGIVADIESATYTEITIKLVGSGWEFDDINVPVTAGEAQAFLHFPPLNCDFTVQTSAAVSAVVDDEVVWTTTQLGTYAGHIDSGQRVIIDQLDPATGGRVDGTEQVILLFEPSFQTSSTREQSVVKFGGRPQQSVAYGIGKTQSFSFSGLILEGESDYAGLYEVKALENAGVCVLRLPDSQRYLVTFTQINIAWDLSLQAYKATLQGQVVGL